MFLEYLKAFSAVFSFMTNVIIQVISFRYFSRIGLLRSIYLGFSFGMLFLACLWFYIFFNLHICLKDYLGLFVSNSVTYVSLGYSYFHFLNLGETARRIRILRELFESKDGLSYEEILQCYNSKIILDIRLKRLMDSGQIELKNKRYHIAKPLVLVFAQMIVRMKKLLYGKTHQSFMLL
jgi:hypothetical protein